MSKKIMRDFFRSTAIVIIAALFICFSGSGVLISNAENNGSYMPSTGVIYRINPLYAGAISEDDINRVPESKITQSSVIADSGRATTEAQIINDLRDALKRRDLNIRINYEFDGTGYDGSSLVAMQSRAFDAAMNHTGNGSEGDYLKWAYSSSGMQVAYSKKNGKTIGSFIFYMTYYTTSEQEQAVSAKVNQIASSLGLAQKGEYDKILAVYNYVCQNIKYDYGKSLLKYSCYAAAINNSAVCQGYSLLIYRLLNDNGVSCRLVAGNTSQGGHGWNIVRVGSVYYNIDSTWDAGKPSEKYTYFMKCNSDFTDHARWAQYADSTFNSQYPMSSSNYETGTVGSYVAIKSITLNKSKISLKAGEIDTLEVKVNPNKGKSKIIWKSSNTSIAKVNSDGEVKALAAGTCEISASSPDGEVKDSCYITVSGKAAEVKALKLNKKKLKLEKGKKYTLKVTIEPSAAKNTELVWKSSNAKVAKISKKGVVKAKGKGKCKITVMTKDGKKKVTCKVTVK
ncbi:Ig-like domain-containing protein [Butyrivibrio sp. LC3010]|uniref:Ig-like domain-containing protein n=1 Tax=Butyrivibrio sp. LC3010 TaxID=1280680 RepID=UPI0004007DF8|nr:Ig-like domain-containing protein [Butyrivibrio sp. LC3010]